MKLLFHDTETYNEETIKNGSHKYAETVELMLYAYALGNKPARVWDRAKREPMPEDLKEALYDPETIFVSHNNNFDRTVLKRFSRIFADPDRWLDTMVIARLHGLPGSLETLCELFHVDSAKAKDSAGKDLVQLFCKPHPSWKIRRPTWRTHPAEWAHFKEYARRDVEAMRELFKLMPKRNITKEELLNWRTDQRINDRGFAIDTELVDCAIEAIDDEQKALKVKSRTLTSDRLSSVTRRDAFLFELLLYHGVNLDNAQAATIERALENPETPYIAKELMRTRLLATTSSTAKYKTLKRTVNKDGRLRGTLTFCGASRTGRWSGALFQPHNLPRPVLDKEDIDRGIEALKSHCAHLMYDSVMPVTSSAIRGCIVAPPGKKLLISDLANIEGRVQAWLAGEQWKLKAFEEYDAKKGHDLYAIAYSKMFGVTPESVMADDAEGGNQRQIGKVSELAAAYGGGVGSFVTFALAYRLDLDSLAEEAYKKINPRIIIEAEGMWDFALKKRKTLNLSKKTFVVMDSFKRQWRNNHPCTCALWRSLEDGVRLAIANPKEKVQVRDLIIDFTGKWLYIQLPSKRYLCYPEARVDEEGVISFMGVHQYTKKWTRINTYSGKLFENVCQAVARDVMVYNMPAMERRGFEIVLSVHDEVIAEVPDSKEFDINTFNALLAANKPWSGGLPLAAKGFEAYRYRKG